MTLEGWLTLLVVALAVLAMAREWLDPPLALGGSLGILLLSRLLRPETAFAGFSNTAVATVAFLLVIAGRLERGRWLSWLSNAVFGPRYGRWTVLRLGLTVAGLSAFIPNTAVVAVLIPGTRTWAERHGRSPSRLLMPLSFAAIMGGACTLVGTTTNLVVHGMLVETGDLGFGMFELALLAAPLAVIGIVYAAAFGIRGLPERKPLLKVVHDDPREYMTGVRVGSTSPLVDQAVGDIGRSEHVYVAGIEQGGELISPVKADRRIKAGDALVFVGRVDEITDLLSARDVELARQPGTQPQIMDDLSHICEVVVSPSAPVTGRNVRDSGFRGRYDAVVLAVHRHGERSLSKVGDIVLRPGDTLLLRTGPDFFSRWRHSRDFYLVSPAGTARRRVRPTDWVEPLVLAGVVAAATSGFLSLLEASVAGVMVLIGTRRLDARGVWTSLDWPTLMTMATAIGLGGAVVESGVASALASWMIALAGTGSPWLVVSAVFVSAAILTEAITNVAAAAIMFPIAVAAAAETGLPVHALAVAIVLGASTSFISPVGYQTNTMVAGAAGYTLRDFVRIGLPLKAIYVIVGSLAIPLIWI